MVPEFIAEQKTNENNEKVTVISDFLSSSNSIITISLLNCRSVCNKSGFLEDFIKDSDVDIFCVVETWLAGDNDPHVTLCTPEGYCFHHRCRSGGRGGGVSILVKECFCHRPFVANCFYMMNLKTF